eukprot:2655317-Rhodomonas_salina.2
MASGLGIKELGAESQGLGSKAKGLWLGDGGRCKETRERCRGRGLSEEAGCKGTTRVWCSRLRARTWGLGMRGTFSKCLHAVPWTTCEHHTHISVVGHRTLGVEYREGLGAGPWAMGYGLWAKG